METILTSWENTKKTAPHLGVQVCVRVIQKIQPFTIRSHKLSCDLGLQHWNYSCSTNILQLMQSYHFFTQWLYHIYHISIIRQKLSLYSEGSWSRKERKRWKILLCRLLTIALLSSYLTTNPLLVQVDDNIIKHLFESGGHKESWNRII